MFSALKKLARTGDERCPAPTPMSSSLQKKFSRGVHFNSIFLVLLPMTTNKFHLIYVLLTISCAKDFLIYPSNLYMLFQ